MKPDADLSIRERSRTCRSGGFGCRNECYCRDVVTTSQGVVQNMED